ncbi:MAG: PQQ-binding-like beta-propeller repeat protein [Christensenellales bacterium]
MSNDPYQNRRYPQAQPRNRRSQRHDKAPSPYQPPLQQRAVYQPDDERAPLPLGAQGSLPHRREAPASYDAQRYQPQDLPEYEDDDEDAPRLWPKMLALLLGLLLIVAGLLYFLVPKDQTGILGTLRGGLEAAVTGVKGVLGLKEDAAPALIKFETPLAESLTGVKTVFTFSADGPIDGVRMVDDQGTEVKGALSAVDAEKTLWTLSVVFDQPMSGTLRAGLLKGTRWYDSDKTISFTVTQPTPEPLPTLAAPTATLEPLPIQTPPPPADPTAEPFSVIAQTAAPLVIQTPGPTQQAAVLQIVPITLVPLTPAPTSEPPQTLEELPAEELIDPADVFDPAAGDALSPDAVFVPEVSAAPVVTAEPAPTPAPTLPPEPTTSPLPLMMVAADEKQTAAAMKITDTVYQKGKKLKALTRTEPLRMPAPGAQRGLYVNYDGGVFTFRNDSFRANAAFGMAEMPLKQLSVLWQAPLGSLRTADGTLSGLGWTGQPAIVKWAKDLRPMMNLAPEKKEVTALKEVIVAAQDGKVYFFDLNDGAATRQPINVGYPLRGSVAVDTAGQPLIAFGQAASKMPGKTGPIGYYFYSLIDQKELYFLNGRQTKTQSQYSTNGAFDGSGLFDHTTSSLVIAGENGLLYTLALNTKFDYLDTKTLSVSPEITYLKSKGQQDNMTVTMEASVAMYGQYAYTADRQGLLRCVDTDTMTTAWAFDAGDNTDATPALGFDADGSLGLYTGTTVFTRSKKAGNALIRRLDALTGAEVWQVAVPASYDQSERGGVKASPVVGEKGISDLVIFTVNATGEGETATILALDRATGAEVWRHELDNRSISSPVAVYTPSGEAFLIQADEKGILTLLEGRTGTLLHTLDLGGGIEASPAVYNDVLVIGTNTKDKAFLYGIRLE